MLAYVSAERRLPNIFGHSIELNCGSDRNLPLVVQNRSSPILAITNIVSFISKRSFVEKVGGDVSGVH